MGQVCIRRIPAPLFVYFLLLRVLFFVFLVTVEPVMMVMTIVAVLIRAVMVSDQQHVDQKRNRVKRKREIQNVLIVARLRNDKVCDLVTRQAGESPRRECDAVDCGNLTHTVNVGKERRQVAEPAAVAEVNDDQKRYANKRDAARNRTR